MKQPLAYCLFETDLGWCAIAWRVPPNSQQPSEVALFQLPAATAAMTEELIVQDGASQRLPPPGDISRVIEKVRLHLSGEPQDFLDVELDLTGKSEFAQRVYAMAQAIPAGQTRSYGEIANALQRPDAARAVGQVLGKNPIALIIPCHRVLAANGKAGGFSAPGGIATKARMLALEGVKLVNAPTHKI